MSPISDYLKKFFVSVTSAAIIERFELYYVSDLCKISDAQIEEFQRSGELSWSEERMLKHIVNHHKTISTQHVGSLGSEMRQMNGLLQQLHDLY